MKNSQVNNSKRRFGQNNNVNRFRHHKNIVVLITNKSDHETPTDDVPLAIFSAPFTTNKRTHGKTYMN